MTKVTVCMATYNGAKYIREQIDSILSQEFVENPDTEMEIIVSDDGSTDATLEILNGYNDPRIKIYNHRTKRHKYYSGMFACTANFGHALSKATGDYVFMSDQDDIWYSSKLDKTLSLLKEKGGVCATAFHVVSEDLTKRYGTNHYAKEPVWRLKKRHSFYGFSCGLTRDLLNVVLPIPNLYAHDTFIMWIGTFLNKTNFINEPLAEHRWTGAHNTSSQSNNAPFFIKSYYRAKMIIVAFARSIKYRLSVLALK